MGKTTANKTQTHNRSKLEEFKLFYEYSAPISGERTQIRQNTIRR